MNFKKLAPSAANWFLTILFSFSQREVAIIVRVNISEPSICSHTSASEQPDAVSLFFPPLGTTLQSFMGDVLWSRQHMSAENVWRIGPPNIALRSPLFTPLPSAPQSAVFQMAECVANAPPSASPSSASQQGPELRWNLVLVNESDCRQLGKWSRCLILPFSSPQWIGRLWDIRDHLALWSNRGFYMVFMGVLCIIFSFFSPPAQKPLAFPFSVAFSHPSFQGGCIWDAKEKYIWKNLCKNLKLAISKT